MVGKSMNDDRGCHFYCKR